MLSTIAGMRSISHQSVFRLLAAALTCVIAGGCASVSGSASTPRAVSAVPPVPVEFMEVSRVVKLNFIYNNDRPMTWPPIKNIDGIVVGNCMTYSRMVQNRLRKLGYRTRFRNVLAPVFPREHVVTAVTDRNGFDWVFDNRRPRPFPLTDLSRYYDFEIGGGNAFTGAQRRKWQPARAPSN